MAEQFRALRVFKTDDGQETRLVTLSDADLMDGDVDVRVDYSTLNYKDGLALDPRHRFRGRRGALGPCGVQPWGPGCPERLGGG